MMSFSGDKQSDVIDVFNTTSRYLDDISNINNVYFDNMESQITFQSSNLISLYLCYQSRIFRLEVVNV